MDSTHLHEQPPLEEIERPVALRRYVQLAKAYAPAIALSLAAVAIAYSLYALFAYIKAPSEVVASLPFRLDFAGASESEYPNHLKFSANDITSTPVLLSVYEANNLSRFVPFTTFARAIYVSERNPAYESLVAEYRARLADTKLTAVDRDRIEKEFASKRDALNKNEYAIHYMGNAEPRLPATVMRKVLSDTLNGWAKWATTNRRALAYNVAVVSPSVVDEIAVDPANRIASIHMLRVRLREITDDLRKLKMISGVELVTTPDRHTIKDVHIQLEDLERFQLEPLATAIESSNLVGDRARAIQFLETQIEYDRRRLRTLELQAAATRDALNAYTDTSPGATARRQSGGGGKSEPAGSGETVMPQLSDSFLDRIVEISHASAEQKYRQTLTEELHDETVLMIPTQQAVEQQEKMLERVRAASGAQASLSPEDLTHRIERVKAEVRVLIGRVHEIHRIASRNLNPSTELYTVMSPMTVSVERSADPKRLFLIGIGTLLAALPIIFLLILLHNRLREEELQAHDEARQDDATSAVAL